MEHPTERAREARLRAAPIEVVGAFEDASNATLLVRLLDHDPRPLDELAAVLGRDVTVSDLEPDDLGVYKPRRGERPLWDFPEGTLHLREVAAYEVSVALGWELVPATVLREDAPYGPGSLQRFVDHDPDLHYFVLAESGSPAVAEQLRRMVVFDLVIDNADRKGGHVLLEHARDADGRLDGEVRLVDHGVTFNVERKLRTVAWELAGQPVPGGLRAEVARLQGLLAGELGTRLAALLSVEEVEVLDERLRELAELDAFPHPSGRRPYPWPLL